MRLFALITLLCLVAATLSCGSGSNSSTTNNPLSGNWEVTLVRHNLTTQFLYSGFLLQSGSSVTGSLILDGANGCAGVGPVSGTLTNTDLQLDINEFGQDLSLTATLPNISSTGAASLSGQFSTAGGGCTDFSSTGTWTAIRVPALTGPFHGSFVVTGNNATTIDVTGTLTQGPNLGASNAALSGTMSASGGTPFCPYLTTATVTGLITGTGAGLNLYGTNGSLSGQITGTSGSSANLATVAPDASSLTGNFTFSNISTNCSGLAGTVTLTFP